MTFAELRHRAQEQACTQAERFGFLTPRVDVDRAAFLCCLERAAEEHFYPGVRDSIRTLSNSTFPDWVAKAEQEAERLCGHEVELLNLEAVQLGERIDWHRDPLTGKTWERLFWSNYRLEGDPAGRDPKIIHELNRHQHLPRLAKAFFLTGNERYAAEALGQLESWIDQNPIGFGVNWHSSLEIGLRSISWMWTLVLLASSRSLRECAAGRIGESLFAQLEHVCRHTSQYSSPNTHLTGEATALFVGGLTFRDYPRARAWLECGTRILIDESERQILPDGFHGELSTYYHCYTLDFYLQALILAERHGVAMPRAVRDKVSLMLDVILYLTRPDGTLPLLGDDDGGRALALDTRTYRRFQDGLCTGAVLFDRGDLKWQAGAFCQETAWLLGVDASEKFHQMLSVIPSKTNALFGSAGYAVQRSGWGSQDTHLVFDAGTLGMGKGAHGHADALAVTVFGGGIDVLIDPGTFVYNGAPRWRRHFRSTAAHNTVTIDGRNQAEPEGTFRWRTPIATNMKRETREGIDYVEADHDAYGPLGVTHRRRLLHIRDSYWLVVDDFRGSGMHRYSIKFHFAGEAQARIAHQTKTQVEVSADPAGFSLVLCASAPVAVSLDAGLASHGYGHLTKSSTLEVTLEAPVPTFVMTFLCCGQPPRIERRTLDRKALLCRCERDGVADIAFVSPDELPLTIGGLAVRAEFGWLRFADDGIGQAFIPGLDLIAHEGTREERLCAQFVA